MATVTVVMPAFQTAKTLAPAIRSIVRQSWTDWQLIIVDDGSTDDTGATAAALASSDERIRLIRSPANHGAAAAMNRAWRLVDSRYIAIMDADDVALPQRLERQLQALETDTRIDAVGTGAHFATAQGEYLRTVRLPREHTALQRRRWYQSPFIHPTVMMRRSFLEGTGGYTDGLRLGEDYDLWMRGFAAGRYRYSNLPEPLLIYRTRRVQRWPMIRASAGVRWRAGRREKRSIVAGWAAGRVLIEGLAEQTGIFGLRRRPPPPIGWNAAVFADLP
jgi:glycosyltransferase involved in cell wall biosynthesis